MTVFGKNILENLTVGMYSDSRAMYREYVQNACEAMDNAVQAGTITREKTRVDICIDQDKREIRIRDNGSGIPREDFIRVLSDIANSDKKGMVDKGFRGRGRLCGLAYCDKLQFISSATGETEAGAITWDARKMRTMLNNDCKYTADEVLGAILQTSTQPTKADEHFFEVVMTDVTSPDLLDKDAIRDYLSFEIPVPYPDSFMFYKHIYEHAKSLGVSINEYNVIVNDERLLKGYTTRIYSSGKIRDEIKDIQFRDFYDENKKLMAWMWFGLSSLNGKIKPQGNLQRGLRLRKGNVQIGNSGTLRRLFRDVRGNEYFIGEVFAIHPDLIPNARHDYFNENAVRDTFETQLREFFKYLWKLCNIASNERSTYQKIQKYLAAVAAYEEKAKTGLSSDVDQEIIQIALEEKRQRAERAQRTLRKSKESADDEIITRVKHIVRDVETAHTLEESLKPLPPIPTVKKPVFLADELSQYPDELSQYPIETRRVVGRIYDLIKQNAPDIARNLITKIHAGLKSQKE